MKLNAIFFASQITITSVCLFLQYKLIYNYCGAEQLGLFSLLMAISGVTKLAEFGMGAGIVKYIAQYKHENNISKCKKIIETSVLFVTVVTLALMLLIYVPLNYAINEQAPKELLSSAEGLIPYILILLVITSIYTALQSAIDGLNFIYIRAIILSIGSVMVTFVVFLQVEKYGLIAVVGAQIAVGIIYILSYLVFLYLKIGRLCFLPKNFCKDSFREMLKYNSSFQTITLISLVFDPITKALLGYFGGLANVGLYELASKLLSQIKNLIALPNQVIVPIIARKAKETEGGSLQLYKLNLALILSITAPIYGIVVLSIPAISELWIGTYSLMFVNYSIILSAGFFINGLSNPAYYYSIGRGELGVNIVTHIIIATINLVLGGMLGIFFGGVGVVAGWSISLAAGSVYLILKTQNLNGIKINDVLSNSDCVRVAFIILSAVALSYVFPMLPKESAVNNLALSVLVGLIIFSGVTKDAKYFNYLLMHIKKKEVL